MALRPYQQECVAKIYASWKRGARVVMPVIPTGGGKTKIFCDILAQYDGESCAVAHRQELVYQISAALGANGVRHRIIAPDSIRREIERQHMELFGRRWVDQRARCAVAGVDTLIRLPSNDQFLPRVGLWVQDEGHHVLKGNKWGEAASRMFNARGLCPTATPCRSDGKGLGFHHDGLVDEMIKGPSLRDLIDMGYLTDYRLIAPDSDLDLSDVNVTSSGDYSGVKLAAAVKKSHLTGDVVSQYVQVARGELGVTFASNVEHAGELAARYRDCGIKAEVVSAKTDARVRAMLIQKFRDRKLDQLVNVDLFGEGFDLPTVSVVSMARPTQSLGLYCQQAGRALRVSVSPELMAVWGDFTDAQRRAHIAASAKPSAIIIDHVSNWRRHMLPDTHRIWTLDRREKRASQPKDDVTPLRACPNPDRGDGVPCAQVYERIYPSCPYCKHTPAPIRRAGPEEAYGNLCEVDPAILAALRGAADKIIGPAWVPKSVNDPRIAGAIRKVHETRKASQLELRGSISLWAGWQRHLGRQDDESYRRFYRDYGVDVLTATTLGTTEAIRLNLRIQQHLTDNGVTPHEIGSRDTERCEAGSQ
jgi:superfamily II DNA or RNA helicase